VRVLERHFGTSVGPEDFAAYLYGVLAHPHFVELFSAELEGREIRVPITKERDVFAAICAVGRRLLWLHTFCERFLPDATKTRQVPRGKARCPRPVSTEPKNYPEQFSYDSRARSLEVGDGMFAPVEPDVWEFEVSGLRVLQSWLGYRMRKRHGRRSSLLDEIHPKQWTAELTTELLHLLWILEATLLEYPDQKTLFRTVMKGPTFRARDLPRVQNAERVPPSADYGQERLETAHVMSETLFTTETPLLDMTESLDAGMD
jgi:hypothetical protein